MQPKLCVAWLVIACASAQDDPSPAAEQVAAVLRKCDPLQNGKGAAELFGPGVDLDAAIQATARSTTAERVVRGRALQLARVLDLVARLKRGQTQREVAWWLALDEIDRQLPDTLRPLLLARAGIDKQPLAAALQELATARETAGRFCRDWNETRAVAPTDAAQQAENSNYDALEAALTKAGPAAVPALFEILAVPPELAFGRIDPSAHVSARQQVRAIFALGSFLRIEAAVPFFVMHARGPSLTQSADAGMVLQELTGEHFGAAFLTKADDDALLAWWSKHRGEHTIGLDSLVWHVVRRAQGDLRSGDAHRTTAARCALMRLDRVLGGPAEYPPEAGVEVLQARLDDVESAWLQRDRGQPR